MLQHLHNSIQNHSSTKDFTFRSSYVPCDSSYLTENVKAWTQKEKKQKPVKAGSTYKYML